MASRFEIEAYYRTIAPYYAAEVEGRGDLAAWVALARRERARRVLDLGTGGGRVARALARDDPARSVSGVDITTALVAGDADAALVLGDMRALPFRSGSFDLVCAGNDPFAHLLRDVDRVMATREMRRVLAADGLAVIDGLRLSADERRRAATELVRERSCGRVRVRERWRAVGPSVYEAVYEYRREGARPVRAVTHLREWRPGEPALAACELGDALDGSPFHPETARVVIRCQGGARASRAEDRVRNAEDRELDGDLHPRP